MVGLSSYPPRNVAVAGRGTDHRDHGASSRQGANRERRRSDRKPSDRSKEGCGGSRRKRPPRPRRRRRKETSPIPIAIMFAFSRREAMSSRHAARALPAAASRARRLSAHRCRRVLDWTSAPYPCFDGLLGWLCRHALALSSPSLCDARGQALRGLVRGKILVLDAIRLVRSGCGAIEGLARGVDPDNLHTVACQPRRSTIGFITLQNRADAGRW